jgi:hypothetical protein
VPNSGQAILVTFVKLVGALSSGLATRNSCNDQLRCASHSDAGMKLVCSNHFWVLLGLKTKSDLARDIYKNATLEKIAFIRIFSERGQREAESSRIWEESLLVSLACFLSLF